MRAHQIYPKLTPARAVVGTAATPEVDSHNSAWQEQSASFAIPVGTRSITYTMDFIRHSGSDLDAFVDDNSLIVTTPAAATPPPASFAGGLFLLGGLGTFWIYSHKKRSTP